MLYTTLRNYFPFVTARKGDKGDAGATGAAGIQGGVIVDGLYSSATISGATTSDIFTSDINTVAKGRMDAVGKGYRCVCYLTTAINSNPGTPKVFVEIDGVKIANTDLSMLVGSGTADKYHKLEVDLFRIDAQTSPNRNLLCAVTLVRNDGTSQIIFGGVQIADWTADIEFKIKGITTVSPTSTILFTAANLEFLNKI